MADDGRPARHAAAHPGLVPLGRWHEHPPLQPARQAKLRNIERNPRVSLHLDGNGRGGDIVVCLGEARVSDDPPADEIPDYVEKYAPLIERNRWSPASFAADYSVPLRITISRIRGH